MSLRHIRVLGRELWATLTSQVEVEVWPAPLLATYWLGSADVSVLMGQKRGMLLVIGHSFSVLPEASMWSLGILVVVCLAMVPTWY